MIEQRDYAKKWPYLDCTHTLINRSSSCVSVLPPCTVTMMFTKHVHVMLLIISTLPCTEPSLFILMQLT